MAIPDYADERSHEFFTRSFVGKSHGENGTGYIIRWDTMHEALRNTATLATQTTLTRICAYCGNRALSIQSEEGSYPVVGHTCCCKGAMDEREFQDKTQELKARHNRELNELHQQAPKVSPDAIRASLKAISAELERQALREIEDSCWPTHGASPVDSVIEMTEQLRKVRV